jgi:hypothetical protein
MRKIARELLESSIIRKNVIVYNPPQDGVTVVTSSKKMFGKDVLKIIVSRSLKKYIVDVHIYLYDENMVFVSFVQIIPYNKKYKTLVDREPNGINEFTKIKEDCLADLIVSLSDTI